MKIKIAVVDFELPSAVKRWAVRIGIPLSVLAVGGVALAGTPLHTWSSGDTLKSTDLNGNFSNLQTQLTALQAQSVTIAKIGSNTGLPSAPTIAAIGSITLSPPSAGVALVLTDGQCSAGGAGLIEITMGTQAASETDSPFGVPVTFSATNENEGFSLSGVFAITTPGPVTYYLNAYASGAGAAGTVCNAGKMIVQFIPTTLTGP